MAKHWHVEGETVLDGSEIGGALAPWFARLIEGEKFSIRRSLKAFEEQFGRLLRTEEMTDHALTTAATSAVLMQIIQAAVYEPEWAEELVTACGLGNSYDDRHERLRDVARITSTIDRCGDDQC